MVPERLAGRNPDGHHVSRVAGGSAGVVFDRADADDDHVAADRGRRFDVLGRFRLPTRLASGGIEAEERAVFVLMKSLPDDDRSAVGGDGGRAEKRFKRFAIDFGRFPDRPAGLGVQAGEQAGVAAKIGHAPGDKNAIRGDGRRGEKHRVGRGVGPERLKAEG